MQNLIKIILAVLFFICLANMPYGYYQFVRFAALVGFGVLAFIANENKNEKELVIYVCLAILFQPIIKIPLGRLLWNITDVVVGISLLVSVIKKPNSN